MTFVATRARTVVGEVFAALDQAGVRWVLLRGIEGLGDPGRDVDLLIDAADLRVAEQALSDLGGVALPRRMHPWHRFYVIGGARAGRGVKLDVVTELIYRRGAPIHSGLEGDCLSRRVRREDVWVLSATDMFWTVLLHCVLDKHELNRRRGTELDAVVDGVTRPSSGEQFWDRLYPVGWSAEQALACARSRDWEGLARLCRQAGASSDPGAGRDRAWSGTRPVRAGRVVAGSAYLAFCRARRRLGVTSPRGAVPGGHGPSDRHRAARQLRVSFSGLDGSGKTRQIDALVDAVGADRSVEVLWVPFRIWPETLLNRLPAGFRSRLGPKRTGAVLAGSAGAEGRRGDGRRALRTAVWTSVGTMAAVSAGLSLRHRVAASGAEVVVLDRYRIDTIVKLQFWYGDVSAPWLARVVTLLAPAPDVEFVLRVDPEVAYRRKPEQWSVGQLSRQARLYDALVAAAPRSIGLDGHLPADQLARRVLSRVGQAVDGR